MKAICFTGIYFVASKWSWQIPWHPTLFRFFLICKKCKYFLQLSSHYTIMCYCGVVPLIILLKCIEVCGCNMTNVEKLKWILLQDTPFYSLSKNIYLFLKIFVTLGAFLFYLAQIWLSHKERKVFAKIITFPIVVFCR